MRYSETMPVRSKTVFDMELFAEDLRLEVARCKDAHDRKRTVKKLTDGQLAKDFGVSPSLLCHLLSNRLESITLGTFTQLLNTALRGQHAARYFPQK